MAILLDTNILLPLLQTHHPHAPLAERAISRLRSQNEILTIAPQNLMEFWAVATRPAGDNGLGMAVVRAREELEALQRLFTLLTEPEAAFREWERLVVTHQVSGKSTHDTHLVAVMNVHGITRILTFNDHDFIRYKGITPVHPALVA